MPHISDPRFVPRDKNSMAIQKLRPRMTNVELRAAAGKCRADNRKQKALHVVTPGNTTVSEELSVSYGISSWIGSCSLGDLHEYRITLQLETRAA